jgi:DNA gyrase/topoisomerase IV subunit B
MKQDGPMPMEPDPVVLLIISEDDWDAVKQRRGRDKEAIFAVDDVVTPEREHDLWVAFGCPSEDFDPELARYRYVCLIGQPDSPLVTWGLDFFRTSMRPLVERGGLFTCPLPFHRKSARQVAPDD